MSPDAQVGLLTKAQDEKATDDVKISLYKSLATNAKFFGNQLDKTRKEHDCVFDQGSDPMTLPNGELAVVSGHPGTTQRLLTMAQLQFQRDIGYPGGLAAYKTSIRRCGRCWAKSTASTVPTA